MRIAITGHSRGGKTTMLAGATDERIALTHANNSGAGGAGCFRQTPPGAESLADLLRVFPFWFGPQMQQFVAREHGVPFDQHALKALIAPRAVLSTAARGDAWTHPHGTWLTHEAARPVFHLLNAKDQLGIVFRDGGHAHTRADWHALLDFADWRLRRLPTARTFTAPSPFDILARLCYHLSAVCERVTPFDCGLFVLAAAACCRPPARSK